MTAKRPKKVKSTEHMDHLVVEKPDKGASPENGQQNLPQQDEVGTAERDLATPTSGE